MIWYAINLFIIFIFIALYLVIKKSDRKWSKINDYLGQVANTVTSVRYGNLAAKLEKIDHPNYQNLSESINRMVETLNDREKMIIEYQSELTRQNKFLEAVINSLSDGIVIIDDSYNILRITPKLSFWLKQEGKDLVEKNLLDYIQSKNNVKPEKFNEEEIYIKNNSSASFAATTMKLNLEDRKKRYVLIIKDTTNEKELEKLREDFVATLTHDLKVPIVAESNILGFLLDNKFGEINEKQKEAISNMKSCNNELLDLVHILLETYKVNEQGLELEKEITEINPFIQSIIDEMQPISNKSNLNINFNSNCNQKIQIDKLQIKRAVKNIIQNALSHSGSKDIDVNLTNDNNFVIIGITDYGKGIPKENLNKIFNKYYSTAQKFRKVGTGLGLYLSLQIIKAHGGEITVDSTENVSTEFCIKLPL